MAVIAEGGASVESFSTRAAARILAVPPDRIRYWVKHDLIRPSETRGREFRFAFRDLLVMRLAKELLPGRRHLEPVRRSLERVRGLVGPSRSVTSLRMLNDEGRIVVRERRCCFDAESGQLLLGFGVSTRPESGGALSLHSVRRMIREIEEELEEEEQAIDSATHDLFPASRRHGGGDGCAHHLKAADEAERKGNLAGTLRNLLAAAALDHTNAQVHIRLGLLYRKRGDLEAAVRSFLRAIEHDADAVEPHRNLAELYERLGRKREALRHLSTLHRLIRDA
jgi:DNA-binding transcriptional MerR regulator